MILMKYSHSDDGDCRGFYTAPLKKEGDTPALYCWQDEGNGQFIFYRCTHDWEEPQYSLTPKKGKVLFEKPQGSYMAKALTKMLQEKNILADIIEE